MPTDPSVAVACLGVTDAARAALRSLWSMPMLPRGERAVNRLELLVIGDADPAPEALIDCIGRNTVGVVELVDDAVPALDSVTGPPGAMARGAGFRVSVTTESAISRPIAAMVRRGLTTRMAIETARADDIETAVHEALMNGALHGNLGIGSVGARDHTAYAQFVGKLQSLLQAGAGRDHRVGITVRIDGPAITIEVVDQGDGFDSAAALRRLHQDGTRTARPGGRGLLIIEQICDALAFGEGGRVVALRFSQ